MIGLAVADQTEAKTLTTLLSLVTGVIRLTRCGFNSRNRLGRLSGNTHKIGDSLQIAKPEK